MLWVTPQQSAIRLDEAFAWYGNGWVRQTVDHPYSTTDCNIGACSTDTSAVLNPPPWVNPVTSTTWYNAAPQGAPFASITPGFSWVLLRSTLCWWDGRQWNHKVITHYVRADLTLYS
jgi:hypothetical protein